MYELKGGGQVFGRTKVLDGGAVMKLMVPIDHQQLKNAIDKLPTFFKGIGENHLPRYLEMKEIEILVYKFRPTISNPKGIILKRNLEPGNIIDLLLVISQADKLKRRLVVACFDRLVKEGSIVGGYMLPALEFRDKEIEFKMVNCFPCPRNRMICYLATRR